jgi:hypothetical protein
VLPKAASAQDLSSSNFPRFDVNPNTGGASQRQPSVGYRFEHDLPR